MLVSEDEADISIIIEALCSIKHSLKYFAAKGQVAMLEELFINPATIYPFFHSKNNQLLLFLLDFLTIVLEEAK
jgi:hypothetical protein